MGGEGKGLTPLQGKQAAIPRSCEPAQPERDQLVLRSPRPAYLRTAAPRAAVRQPAGSAALRRQRPPPCREDGATSRAQLREPPPPPGQPSLRAIAERVSLPAPLSPVPGSRPCRRAPSLSPPRPAQEAAGRGRSARGEPGMTEPRRALRAKLFQQRTREIPEPGGRRSRVSPGCSPRSSFAAAAACSASRAFIWGPAADARTRTFPSEEEGRKAPAGSRGGNLRAAGANQGNRSRTHARPGSPPPAPARGLPQRGDRRSRADRWSRAGRHLRPLPSVPDLGP